jgi:hypothetical protein
LPADAAIKQLTFTAITTLTGMVELAKATLPGQFFAEFDVGKLFTQVFFTGTE